MSVRGFHDPTQLEYRHDRPYDEQTPSHLLMPNGSSVDFTDRALGNVLAREVLGAHLQAAIDAERAALPTPVDPALLACEADEVLAS